MPEHAPNDSEAKTAAGAPCGEDKNAIGDLLRKQRKARGISLVEVSEHTKIGKKYLEALENEEYGVLPGDTYTLGFLRAYAKYLELDDADILKRYKQQKRIAPNAADDCEEGTGSKGDNGQSIWMPLMAVLVLAGLGAGLFLLWPTGKERVAGKEEAADIVNPDLRVSQPPVPAPGAPLASDLTLKIRAKEKTWITLMIDGRQEPDVTLNLNEERTWTAKDRFVLWTGNAGGVEVTFNGEPQPPLGLRGEVRKEVIFERKPGTAPAVNPVLP